MIYTSYLAKAGKNPKAVMITRTVPNYFKGLRCIALAPPKHLFGLNDPDLFTERYREEVLSKLDAKEIAAQFEGMILTCYEGPGKFCHRQVVAQWLREEAGVEVQEWQGEGGDTTKGPKADIPEQLDLF
ncbi:MAG TPA: hypothetical protein PLY04_17185 [bacterium]|nr:hypothetical protein [bacterium]